MVFSVVVAAGQEFRITSYTIDGGGATFTSGGEFELSGTIGQPDAGGPMTGGAFTLTGGFWTTATSSTAQACVGPGDLDGDGDVDLVDFGEFQLCFTGGTGMINEGCECADFDGDNDADLVDFGEFQLAFSGSGA
jgi:hypothetical protein